MLEDLPCPWSHYKHERMPIRGEDAVFVRGEGLEKTTRVLEWWGRVFVLGLERTGGAIGKDPYVGTRAARTNLFVHAEDPYETHLVDCRHIKTTYKEKEYKSAHLLVYVPCKVLKWEDDPDPPDLEKAIAHVEQLLDESAHQWDGVHPAHQTLLLTKEYVLVPESGPHPDEALFRIRHFFGAREAMPRLPLPGESASNQNWIYVHPYKGRATGGHPMHLFYKYGSDTQPHRKTPIPEAIPLPPEPDYSARWSTNLKDDKPIDDDWQPSNTLAHELGHRMGYPDEYLEFEHGYPEFFFNAGTDDSSEKSKPYHLDEDAMMVGNQLQRLRYWWVRARELAKIRDKLLKIDPFGTGPAYVPRYETDKLLLEHRVPHEDEAGNEIDLWEPVVNTWVGRSRVAVYRVGDDEGARCKMFRPAKKGLIKDPVDGAIVIQPRLYFRFYDTYGYEGDAAKNKHNRRKVTWDRFAQHYLTRDKMPGFVLARPTAPFLKRIGVVWCPRVADWGYKKAYDGDWHEEADALVTIYFVHDNDFSLSVQMSPEQSQARIEIEARDMGPWLMRYLIDDTLIDPNAAALDKRPLEKADLQKVADMVSLEPMLGGYDAKVEDL